MPDAAEPFNVLRLVLRTQPRSGGSRAESMDELQHLPNGIAAFEALGNAVNVTVVERILGNLLKLLSARRVKSVRDEQMLAAA